MKPRRERMNDVVPDWEPTPWDAKDVVAEPMYEGFLKRAALPITWTGAPLLDFPQGGIFGHDREWFTEHDVAFFSTYDGEELILVDNVWFGWPDPPRWQLASRAKGSSDRWQSWGCFPELPSAWSVPQEKKSNAAN